MFVYFGNTWTVTVKGEGWRVVDCEHCGRHFEFAFIREGVGSAHNPYYADNEKAERIATKRANKDLAKNIANDAVPVPCPGCGMYQTAMLKWWKRDRHRLWYRPSWLSPFLEFGVTGFGVIGLFALLIGWAGSDRTQLAVGTVFSIPFAVLYAIRAGVCCVALFRRWRFDPYRRTSVEYRMRMGEEYTVPAKPMAQPVLSPVFEEQEPEQRRASPILSPIFDDEPDRPPDQQ